MANTIVYRVVLTHSEEGYAVSCPGLPDCSSRGATEEEALTNVKDAITFHVKTVEEMALHEGGRMVEISVA
jgi:predicted RNase H-like HicB family nuclease